MTSQHIRSSVVRVLLLSMPLLLSCGDWIPSQNGDYSYDPPDALHNAVATGNISTASRYLSLGYDVNNVLYNGSTPLHAAAIGGHVGAGRWLIENSAHINVTNDRGESPLFEALEYGNTDFANMLITKGANPNIQNEHGMGILHMSAAYDLISPEVEPKDIVRTLIGYGACVDIATVNGLTPLHTASYYGKPDIVSELLLAGARRDLRDDRNRMPIDLAIEKGHDDIVRLLRNGPVSDKRNKPEEVSGSMNTALNAAASASALYDAARAGDVALGMQLIASGSTINATDRRGKSPLYAAVENGNGDFSDMLVREGANPNLQSVALHSQLSIAVLSGDLNTLEKFLLYGADPNIANANKKTPLHEASESGNLQMVQMLLEAGADRSIVDGVNRRPVDYAVAEGHRQIVRALSGGESVDDATTAILRSKTPVSVSP